jgi:hypothetical protein
VQQNTLKFNLNGYSMGTAIRALLGSPEKSNLGNGKNNCNSNVYEADQRRIYRRLV